MSKTYTNRMPVPLLKAPPDRPTKSDFEESDAE